MSKSSPIMSVNHTPILDVEEEGRKIALSNHLLKQTTDYVFDTPSTMTFIVDGLKIDVFYHLRRGVKKIAFLGQSALSKENKKKGLPFFFRNSWVTDLNCSTVIFNDPTLYIAKQLQCGWSQGTPKHFAVESMAKVCEEFIIHTGDKAKFGFYGSSAGGFWALFMAAYFNSPCAVETPQTDIFKYPLDDPREQLFDKCYRAYGLNPEHFKHRLSATHWFEHLGQFPSKIKYFQSERDLGHIETQMIPFFERLNGKGCDLSQHMYLRGEDKPAHGPMNRKDSIVAIHELFD